MAVENALAKLMAGPVRIVSAGRTDAGVHALGQVAHFSADTRIGPQAVVKALNSLLPDDIAICHCTIVADGFHARYDARSKLYRYRICNHPVRPALDRHRCWHVRRPLDRKAMAAALALLVGTHNFKSFEGVGSPRRTTVRRIVNARLCENEPGWITIEVEGEGFLRHMVRNIVGTLVDVGLGKIAVEEVAAIRDARDRRRAGITAPACGLYLVKVNY
jgi:tRNA pseudouridine38-40 synthase